ncbi:MAG: hypothetical protein M3Y25_08655 [Thermoproteota archaeon]|nr:hypothetical protein [Thermoproteota archaeon]
MSIQKKLNAKISFYIIPTGINNGSSKLNIGIIRIPLLGKVQTAKTKMKATITKIIRKKNLALKNQMMMKVMTTTMNQLRKKMTKTNFFVKFSIQSLNYPKSPF